MPYRLLIVIVLVATAAALYGASVLAHQQRAAHQQALCGSDSECAELCDPADAECDGGPQ
jgi:hypothetical protein